MKRIFALLLCCVLALSCVACGEGESGENASAQGSESTEQTSSTDSATSETVTSTNTDTDTDTEKNTTSSVTETVTWDNYVFDTSIEHKFFATDIRGHSLVVFDLNKTDGNLDLLTGRSCVVWAWSSDYDTKCTIKPSSGIDAAKYRYSPYYGKDVVIASSSNGWAGVIDYEAKSLIWEHKVGDGPHSIEMMPNGDVVVACSGNGSTPGKLAYIPLSSGAKTPSCEVPSPSSHGVMWDPKNECLWVMENAEIACFKVVGAGTREATLERIKESCVSLAGKDSGGHVISPVLGQPGKYWIGAGGGLWQFDTETRTVTKSYENAAPLSIRHLKGVASFADGTVIQTSAGLGGNTSYDWSSKALRILLFKKNDDGTSRPIIKEVPFKTREFYKVFPFTKDYQ